MNQHFHQQQYNFNNKRYIEVDSLLCNGKLIQSTFKFEPNYSILDISADSLEKGSYQLRGHVLFDTGESIEKERLVHNFEIK